MSTFKEITYEKGRMQILYYAGLQIIFRSQNWQKKILIHIRNIITSTINPKFMLVNARQNHASLLPNTKSKM